MINAMLNLSRLGKNEIQREPVNLSELAALTTQELRHSDPTRQVEFEIMPGLVADGDNKLLHIVVENLLGNAWKFTSRKQDAKITFGMTEKNGKRAYYVKDNGVGFNMTYAEQLFKPFQRFHSAAEFPGTGVGLASIQRIIKRHGGKVWAEAETGKGATFYFTLD
jgi:light-regulated signal transduction histidine kinase (bacteriophytochrome)